MNSTRRKGPSINDFIVPDPQPTVDSVLTRRLEASKSTLLPPLQSEPMQRQEMRTFMTTFRDTANPIEHDEGQRGRRGVGVVSLPPPGLYGSARGDAAVIGGEGGCPPRSLEDVWAKGLYDKPAEMLTIDASKVRRVNPETGNVWVPQYTPERFERGRVQQPRVRLVEVDPSLLETAANSSAFMSPAERREQHDTAVNARRGEEAMREAYRARNRLERTCRMKHPHGVLGVVESPFSAETEGGAMGSTYAANREELSHQQRLANRNGKGHGHHRAPVMHGLLAHNENVSTDRANASAPDPLSLRARRAGGGPSSVF